MRNLEHSKPVQSHVKVILTQKHMHIMLLSPFTCLLMLHTLIFCNGKPPEMERISDCLNVS